MLHMHLPMYKQMDSIHLISGDIIIIVLHPDDVIAESVHWQAIT